VGRKEEMLGVGRKKEQSRGDFGGRQRKENGRSEEKEKS
jgi:hypothetical protein